MAAGFGPEFEKYWSSMEKKKEIAEQREDIEFIILTPQDFKSGEHIRSMQKILDYVKNKGLRNCVPYGFFDFDYGLKCPDFGIPDGRGIKRDSQHAHFVNREVWPAANDRG